MQNKKSFSSHSFNVASVRFFSFLSFFFVCLFVCLFFRFSFIYYFHYLWHQLPAFFTVLITLRYYFISLQTPWIISFSFIQCFHYLYDNYLIIGIFYCLNYTSLLFRLIKAHLVIDFKIPMSLTYVLGKYHDLKITNFILIS